MNFGGAKDRPQLAEVWENVEHQLDDRPTKYDKVGRTGAVGLCKELIFG